MNSVLTEIGRFLTIGIIEITFMFLALLVI